MAELHQENDDGRHEHIFQASMIFHVSPMSFRFFQGDNDHTATAHTLHTSPTLDRPSGAPQTLRPLSFQLLAQSLIRLGFRTSKTECEGSGWMHFTSFRTVNRVTLD